MSRPIRTNGDGAHRFSIFIYADAETKAALYQLAIQRAQSQSRVVCDLINEAAKGKKK